MTRPDREPICRARYEVRSWLARHPSLYLPLARRRYSALNDRVVGAGTDLVIEGYPRSGNTFAAFAFLSAQTRPVRIAYHLHAPAQVVWAARHDVPTLVLVREPEDAVASHLIYERCPTAAQALRAWIGFYEQLIPLRTKYVLADFSSVTKDFGRVTRAVNRRFGTSFGVFEHTEENVEACFRDIERFYVADGGGVAEHRVPRPSDERAAKAGEVKARLRDPSLTRMRTRARTVYEGLLDHEL